VQTAKQKIDLRILPEEARKELIDFYEYLISKYKRGARRAKKRLKEILSNPIGILPDNYKFNREEAHER
jgi:hypothetical protein